MREARLTVIPCDTGPEGNIDVLSDCTVSGPINVTRTVEHIVTKVAWIYDPQTTQYFSQGSYSIDYAQTITGGGTSCTIKKTGAGLIGNSGMLMVINDPAVQQLLGYGYIADGNVDAQVSMTSDCQGYSPQMQNWTVKWLPQIKAFTGTGGSYSGEMTIPLCGGGADSGTEKVTWSFTVPPSK